MSVSTEPGTEAADAAVAAWRALRMHLATRSRELNEEVHRYPTPIARCDDQLSGLLAERARAVRRLRLADEAGEAATGDGIADRLQRLAQFLRVAESSADDDVEHALRRRLAEAIANAMGRTDPAPRG